MELMVLKGIPAPNAVKARQLVGILTAAIKLTNYRGEAPI
jgi:hypothetical protein